MGEAAVGVADVLNGFDAASHIAGVRRDGYTIIENILDGAGIAAFRAALAPHLDRWMGRNPFEGVKTERSLHTGGARQGFSKISPPIRASWRWSAPSFAPASC